MIEPSKPPEVPAFSQALPVYRLVERQIRGREPGTVTLFPQGVPTIQYPTTLILQRQYKVMGENGWERFEWRDEPRIYQDADGKVIPHPEQDNGTPPV